MYPVYHEGNTFKGEWETLSPVKRICDICGNPFPEPDNINSGYGIFQTTDGTEQKVCFPCCGEMDKECLLQTGFLVGYWTEERDSSGKYATGYYFSNLPGSLKIKLQGVSSGKHNWPWVKQCFGYFALPDAQGNLVWFWVRHVSGGMTQIARARKLRKKPFWFWY